MHLISIFNSKKRINFIIYTKLILNFLKKKSEIKRNYFIYLRGFFYSYIIKFNLLKCNNLFFVDLADMGLFLNFLKKSLFNTGYYVELIFSGYGYRWWFFQNLRELRFLLGYSHYIIYKIPDYVDIICKKSKIVLFSGNKLLVNNVSRKIKKFRDINIYKGTGIRLSNEFIKVKRSEIKQY